VLKFALDMPASISRRQFFHNCFVFISQYYTLYKPKVISTILLNLLIKTSVGVDMSHWIFIIRIIY